MSQIFNLCLAPETLLLDAQQLGVTPVQLQRIKVTVSASIVPQPTPQLWLTYQIQLPHTDLATQLNWPAWERAQFSFTDYLWEQTCLECFIASSSNVSNETKDRDETQDPNKATGYIEINASPDGRYALYQFESYRQPSSLPPTPLLQADKKSRAAIHWADELAHSQVTPTSKLFPTNINSLTPTTIALTTGATEAIDLAILIFRPRYCYQRSFGMPIAQLLPSLLTDQPNKRSIDSLNNSGSSMAIKLLHPCVILRFGEITLYFAPTHASPPDFHQRRYWSKFNYQAAQTDKIKRKKTQ